MKVGDFVKCINQEGAKHLKYNETYKVLDFDSVGDPYILVDGVERGAYVITRFIVVSREDKLKRILKL